MQISTAGAQREMMVPSLMAIIVPVATGLVLGVAGVMGLLAGAPDGGFVAGLHAEQRRRRVGQRQEAHRKGNFGGKGSDAHKAGVVGDTVGDPFKDTTGPAMNILIKLMAWSRSSSPA